MVKKLLLIIALFTGAAQANPYAWTITRIVDGDTVAVAAPWVPDPIKKEVSIRIYGVDTPEKYPRSKCMKEGQMGVAATEFTKKAVAGAKEILVEVKSWDKYGGRLLGDIIIDGVSLRSMLIDKGFAREYFGDAKKSWCN